MAPGAVSAALCNASLAAQRWSLHPAPVDDGTNTGATIIRSAAGTLCLGFDSNISAFGGTGNAVVARPCDAGPVTRSLHLSHAMLSDPTLGSTNVILFTAVLIASLLPISWLFNETAGGAFLRTTLPHRCSVSAGSAIACECVHPTECAACHGTMSFGASSVRLCDFQRLALST